MSDTRFGRIMFRGKGQACKHCDAPSEGVSRFSESDPLKRLGFPEGFPSKPQTLRAGAPISAFNRVPVCVMFWPIFFDR